MSIKVTGFIQYSSAEGTTAEGFNLHRVHLYFDEDSPLLEPEDMIMDGDYISYSILHQGTQVSPSQWNDVIVIDVNNSGKAPVSERGSILTPTHKWKLGRVGEAFPQDQHKAIFDDNNIRVIDENLGGDKTVSKVYTITQGNVDEGFVDISWLDPYPSSVQGFTAKMVEGVEQINSSVGPGVTPDFELLLTPVNRLIFKNHGSPTVTLNGHWETGDVLLFVYTHKA